MKKILFGIIFTILPFAANSAPTWMSTFHNVGDIYTYGTKDALAVFLVGSTCPNLRDHYYIDPTLVSNGNQLISIVLTAKAAGKKLRFYVDNAVDTENCYIKGVWMQD